LAKGIRNEIAIKRNQTGLLEPRKANREQKLLQKKIRQKLKPIKKKFLESENEYEWPNIFYCYSRQ